MKYDYKKFVEALFTDEEWKLIHTEGTKLQLTPTEAIDNYRQRINKTQVSRKLGVSRPTVDLWLKKFDRDRDMITSGDDWLFEAEEKR